MRKAYKKARFLKAHEREYKREFREKKHRHLFCPVWMSRPL